MTKVLCVIEYIHILGWQEKSADRTLDLGGRRSMLKTILALMLANCARTTINQNSGMNKHGEIVVVKCENCGKLIFVEDTNIRQKMFCTIGCMDSYATEIPAMV